MHRRFGSSVSQLSILELEVTKCSYLDIITPWTGIFAFFFRAFYAPSVNVKFRLKIPMDS